MKIGGPVKYIEDKETISLTKDQIRHIYRMVELEGVVNMDAIRQEIQGNRLSMDNVDDDDEINPYHKIIVKNIDKDIIITSQMEQWSVLSNVVNYKQYDRNLRMLR